MKILLFSGSQQALDTVGKMFLNPGDAALVGLPSYLGGINAFRSYESNLTGIPLDKDGMRLDILEETIKNYSRMKFFQSLSTLYLPFRILLVLLCLSHGEKS